MTSTAASEAHLTCLCGAISVPGPLLEATEIPLQLEICHCNFCRHTTGSLGMIHSSSRDLAKLTEYKASEKTTLYFCQKCGCHCFISTFQKNWFCTGGIIEQTPSSKTNGVLWPEDIIKVSRHDFVLDTIDGGIVPFLLNLNGRSIPTWSAAADLSTPDTKPDLPHEDLLQLPIISSRNSRSRDENSYLSVKCHCGGVSLLIERGNYTSSSPVEFSTRSLPTDPTKHLTYLCACRSCRLATGVSLTAWTLVPPSSVFNGNLSPAPPKTNTHELSPSIPPSTNLLPVVFGYHTSNLESNLGLTLKHNWSSTDTCRSFYRVCGATVSYWCAKRPLEVDLAVGLFRAEEGSLARSWMEWRWGRCSFEEECVDKEMVEAWRGCKDVMEV
ncbi:hypothetical protein BKA61DRAFT_553276 [Leptodontidium sp. MPI-SDFR-AT-0119]|nr:hypothetical protein BKA61DRAFT_553276 [Leptodontidium sp. MPI-SDFR-AT-0119]